MADTRKENPMEANFEEKEPLNAEPIVIEDVKKNKSVLQIFKSIKGNITVEPILAGHIIPSIIARFAMVNLNLDKACRVNKNFTAEVCDALMNRTSSEYIEYEKQVQQLISSIDIWKGVIHTLLPCIIIMFLGSWSDRTGRRKLCIFLPIFGELLTSISNIINVYYFYEIPVQITIFLEVFFTSVTGGWVIMFLGIFSYISDITKENNRTFRVGMVNICMTAGVPIGLGLSGILSQKLGYYGVFSVTCAMFILILLYGVFILKEPEQLLIEKGQPPIDRTENANVSFFDLTHVWSTIRVAFKARVSNNRVKMILTLLAVFLLYGPTMAEYNIMYLFVRSRLNWNLVQYSIYAMFHMVLHAMGAMFSITIFSRRLQWHDSFLCLISVLSKFVGSIWIAFVQTDLGMYLVPVIEILNATTFTSLRSIVSKLVDKNETARVNSLFSLVETVASLVFNPFYSWLYMVTLQTVSGAVFLFSAALIVPAALILLYFFIKHRISMRKEKKQKTEDTLMEEKPK